MLNLDTVLFTVLDWAAFDGFESVNLSVFSLNLPSTKLPILDGCVCFDLKEYEVKYVR